MAMATQVENILIRLISFHGEMNENQADLLFKNLKAWYPYIFFEKQFNQVWFLCFQVDGRYKTDVFGMISTDSWIAYGIPSWPELVPTSLIQY